MTSSEAFRADKDGEAAGARRVYPRVTSLSSLVGGHPDALRALFGAGRATDPAELGDAPRGRILALSDKSANLHLLTRTVLRLLEGHALWEGKSFDHGGNSGKEVILGKHLFRFRAEVGASVLDGKPALVLSYADAAHKNPWPVSAMGDELRTVGNGIAIGPGMFHGGPASPTIMLWFGLEAR